MKRLFLLAVMVLAACTTAPSQVDPTTMAANAKTQITNACLVIQPTLLSIQAAKPDDLNLAAFTKSNGEFCAAVNTLDYTSAYTLVNTLLPQMLTMVSSLPVDDATKTNIRIALAASSVALSQYLIVYKGQAPVAVPQ